MKSLASDQTVAAIQYAELLSSAWDIVGVSRELALNGARRAGFIPLAHLGQSLEPDCWIQSGDYYLTIERESQELALVKSSAGHPQKVFSNENAYMLLLDKRGRAYTNIGLDLNVSFDSAFLAFRMDSADALMVAWAWINSQSLEHWQEILETVSRFRKIDNKAHRDVLVPEPSKMPQELVAEVKTLAKIVNSDVILEEQERSAYRCTNLKPGSVWFLREYESFTNGGSNKVLGSMIRSVLTGRTQKFETNEGLPSTAEKWLLTGKVSKYERGNGASVLVSAGSVVTSSIGTISRARVVDQEMALANGHFALIPNSDVDPDALADFLNSRSAQKQRLRAVQSGVIPRLNKKDLLKFEFYEVTNVRSRLRKLVSRTVLA